MPMWNIKGVSVTIQKLQAMLKFVVDKQSNWQTE